MHLRLIEKATPEQLRSFLVDQFDELKKTMPEIYKDMECELYEHVNGPHFDADTYEKAVSELQNEDGTTGAHWSIDDIRNVIRSKGIPLSKFNDYDFAYALNMVYSDYYGSVADSVDSYVKIAYAFLNDRDAADGKAWRYWKAMR